MSKVPKLRFPEFEGEWEEKELGEVGEFIGGGTPNTSIPEYWDGEISWYTPTEIKEDTYLLKESRRKITELGLKSSSAKLLPKGSVLITTRATIGDVAIVNKPCATNQGFQSLVVKENQINRFWFYWIIKNRELLIKKASGSTFKEIAKNEIIKIGTIVPQEEEQQKIADCLSSLDELIEARKEKIASLKAYKKGLLQQMFPEGVSKSTPPPLIFNKLQKLRFEGFEGEWEEVKLGEICNITNGKANVQDHIEGGRYPLFDRSEVVKASNEYFLDCETVILPGEGVRFTPKYYKGKFNLHQRAYALKDFSCSGLFLYYAIYAKKDLLATKAVQSTVLSLRLPILQNFEICIPVDIAEQEKIANCLSSLDELIEAKNEKIKLLKSYKKGLLQQLFVN